MGFVGYAAANIVGAWLLVAWELPLVDRVIAVLLPPLAFLAVVRITRIIVGHERIVFYQTSAAGVGAVAVVGAIATAHAARLVDVATIGIGVFLVFGRLGCFAVACCHGRPARFGVVYGAPHVRVGFWEPWSGRRLWPVQLIESAASFALVTIGLVAGWNEPGEPALIYIVGYGGVRFLLEIVRGDAARPHALGLSEAQWLAVASVATCAVWRPSAATIAAFGVLGVMAALRSFGRHRRALLQPSHLRELDRACTSVLRDPEGVRAETSLGVAVSWHPLPDGRLDWVVTATHASWSIATASRLAGALWRQSEIVEGRTPGVVHVIVAPARDYGATSGKMR